MSMKRTRGLLLSAMTAMTAMIAMIAATLSASGCASLLSASMPAHTPRSAVIVDPIGTADCLRTTARHQGFGHSLLDGPVTDPALLAHLVDVPMDVRQTARAAGLESTLARLLQAQAAATDEASVAEVEIRLQVVMRLSSLEIQLASLLFEADCTGDQMEAVLLELDQRAGRRELAYTFASIAAGAIIGVGAGLWDLSGTESKGPAALAIAGGIASAGLGIVALVPKRGAVIFPHEHNLFVPILRGEDPDRLYPTFAFRLLSTPRTAEGRTPRDQLLLDWKNIIHDSIPARDWPLAESMLYGKGGVYDGALVDVRERMFDALESQLNAFDYDLEVLYRYFGRLLDLPGPGAAP